MPGKKITALGAIYIDDKVISAIVGNAAMKCYGIVGLAAKNSLDGLFQLLSRENYKRGGNIAFAGNELILSLSVILEYGVRINAVTENIMENIKYSVESTTGLHVNNIEILVQGLRME